MKEPRRGRGGRMEPVVSWQADQLAGQSVRQITSIAGRPRPCPNPNPDPDPTILGGSLPRGTAVRGEDDQTVPYQAPPTHQVREGYRHDEGGPDRVGDPARLHQ